MALIKWMRGDRVDIGIDKSDRELQYWCLAADTRLASFASTASCASTHQDK
jgi:hypothetical protein